jgi:hypothetical protein
MIDDYKDERSPPKDGFMPLCNFADGLYWGHNEPAFGDQHAASEDTSPNLHNQMLWSW